MQALDGFVARARCHNDIHHDSNVRTLSTLADKVGDAHMEVRRHLYEVKEQSKGFECEAKERSSSLQTSVDELTGYLKRPLSELKSDVRGISMVDYAPTGQTPKKVRYDYPTALPRTESREKLLARSQPPTPSRSARNTSSSTSSSAPLMDSHSHILPPAKGPVYGDTGDEEVCSTTSTPAISRLPSPRPVASTPPPGSRLPVPSPRPLSSKKRLREADANGISSLPPPPDSPVLPPAKRRASLAKVASNGAKLVPSKPRPGTRALPAPTRGGRRLRRENPT